MQKSTAIEMAAWHEESARQARAYGFTSTAASHERDAEFFRQEALTATVPAGLDGRQILLLGCACWLVAVGVVALGVFILASIR